MQNGLLLDPEEFEIDVALYGKEEDKIYCKELIEKWTPQLETEMLEAFIRYYNDEMVGQWGPDDPDEYKEYWPEFKSPAEFVNYVGTDVRIYAAEDAIYRKSKAGPTPYESANIPMCVVLDMNCPWSPELGWAAVFVDGKLLKIQEDVVSGIFLY